MQTIYILLPVHNRKAITEQFVLCLTRQTYKNFHLILIDDGSNDGTSAMVLAQFPETSVIRGTGDWWWGGSLQQGMNWLDEHKVDKNALVLIINDDVSVAPDYLERAVALMLGRKRVLLLSQYLEADGTAAESGVFADLDRLTFQPAVSPDQINCLSTRGLFAYWGDLQEVGSFYPKLLPHYLSDYEFTIRAHKKGFKCETSPELVIIPNYETTGYHKIDDKSFKTFLTKYFSKRSANNPVYWSTFAILACKRGALIHNLLRLWKDSARTILKAYRTSRT